MVTLTAVPVDDWGGSLTVAAVTSYHVLFEMVMRRQSILADAFIRSIIGFLRSVFNIFNPTHGMTLIFSGVMMGEGWLNSVVNHPGPGLLCFEACR